jgi:hypothetical protein
MYQQVITKAIALRPSGNLQTPAPTTPDPYKDRLLKLIPAEVVAVYLGVFQIMTNQKSEQWMYLLVFFLLLVGNIFYKMKAGVHDWVQLLIASIAYFLWVCSLGGPVPNWYIGSQSAQSISAIFVPIFTFFVPLIYS